MRSCCVVRRALRASTPSAARPGPVCEVPRLRIQLNPTSVVAIHLNADELDATGVTA